MSSQVKNLGGQNQLSSTYDKYINKLSAERLSELLRWSNLSSTPLIHINDAWDGMH